MYQTFIPAIKTILEAVSQIKVVHAHPTQKLSQYPAAIFYPISFDNSFESSRDNRKVLNFKIFIVIGVDTTTVQDVFTSVLPKAVDAMVDKFDQEWDGGTIEGHRVSYLLDSGEWGISPAEQGLEAWAEFNLKIKLLTSI